MFVTATGAQRRSKGEIMKHLKTFGLVAIMMLGLTAFIGAGTASATKLWTNNSCTWVYLKGTSLEASLRGTSKFTVSGSTVDACTVSSFRGTTSNESGAYVNGSVESLTWNGCTTTTITVFPGSFSIHWTGGTEGSLSIAGTEVTVAMFGSTCTYGALSGRTLGTISGGEQPLLLVFVSLTKTAGSFLCPETMGWDAEYVFTSPHALYIGN